MEKIKVLQIGGNVQKNGITTYLLNTYDKIREDFTFVFLNTSFRDSDKVVENQIIDLGGKIYHIPYKKDFKDIENELRKIMRKENFDVVHSHYFSSNGLFLKLAYEENIPIRISHCHNNKTRYLDASEEITIIESNEYHEKYATKKLAVTYDAGIFLYGNNSFEINRMVLDLSKFYEIEHKNQLKERYGLDKAIQYSIFVGRFSPQKNVFFLIELAKKIINRKIIMVGDGPLKKEFQTKIKEERIEEKFIFMSDMNLNEIYNLADSLLLPSLYEGLSITIFEAQKAGLICLASTELSKESNKGNVLFLDLEVDKWVSKLNNIKSIIKTNISEINNLEDSVRVIKNFYTSNFTLSDIYVDMGRKFALGSEIGFQDYNKSKFYYEKASQMNNLRGTFYLALMYFEGSGIEKDIEKANNLLKPIISKIEDLSESNNPNYLTILGDLYSFGFGKERNYETAANIYKKAADLGSLEAMCDLGYMYQVGQGVEENHELCFKYYKKSAELGYLHSKRDVALCYIEGIGTNVNLDIAIKWLEKASALNYAHATTDLAWIYFHNDSYKNREKAKELFLLAIRQDKNRAYRDLIANSININSLLLRNEIEFFEKDKLEKPEDIDENILVNGTIVINKNISYIAPNIFYNHPNIKKFFVEKDNPYYASIAGVLYNKEITKLIRFPMASTEKKFQIPKTVKIIGDSAFDDCKNLYEIVIDENIEEIEQWAFHGCDSIISFSLPKSITKIGTYAFGSCENLTKIIVDCDSKFYASFEGCLFDKNLSVLYQYPIGSKLKSYRVPRSVKKIDFRAFSDAFNLEYIDASYVDMIKEKAFYYCTGLKHLIVNKECDFQGENITAFCDEKILVERKYKGRTFLVSDIHGHLRLNFIKNIIKSYQINFKDTVIILGDAGIVWSVPMNVEVEEFYSNLDFTVLFLDGNHENFDELNKYGLVDKYGAKVKKILNNVFHLLRGESYLINSLKILVFGGAYSIKRDTNDSAVKTWTEELPNDIDMNYGLKTIEKNNYAFDYILTHQGPRSFLDEIKYVYSDKEIRFLEFLDTIKTHVKFKHWYFGHIHQDLEIDNISSIYSKVVVVNDF